MKATLRELLKPPFEYIAGHVIDANGLYLLRFYNEAFADNKWLFRDFLLSALNEKWQRDFGGEDEPRRN